MRADGVDLKVVTMIWRVMRQNPVIIPEREHGRSTALEACRALARWGLLSESGERFKRSVDGHTFVVLQRRFPIVLREPSQEDP